MSRSKFISLSASLAVCGVVGFANADGVKGIAPVKADGAVKLTPKRVAKINRNMELSSPWYNVTAGDTGIAFSGTLQFDCFDPNATGFPEDTDGCALGSSRWYFGSTYNNPFCTNDMTLAAGSAAINDGTQHGWYWTNGGQCNVAVFHAEDFDNTCAGPDSGGTFSGVIYDFGSVPSGGYYYYNPLDLTPYGLNMANPADGSGANIHLLGSFNGSTFFLASTAQLMLWGTNVVTRAGDQGEIQWDDDAPTDGTHGAPTECYSYAYGLCPDPLGAMYASYGETQTDCFSMDVSNIVAGQPATFTVSGGPAGNRQYSCAYSFRTGSETYTNLLGYCAELSIDLPADPRSQLAWQQNDADGAFVKTIPIPASAPIGRTIYFQAAARDTCPDNCSSGRVERVIN